MMKKESKKLEAQRKNKERLSKLGLGSNSVILQAVEVFKLKGDEPAQNQSSDSHKRLIEGAVGLDRSQLYSEGTINEAAYNEAARNEAAHNEAAHNEAAHNEAAHNEAAHKEAARNEAARNEAARNEAARNEAARNEAARNEAARNEAARNEAARNEAARNEAARNEAARNEAARNKAARNKAAQNEAAQNEAAQNEAADNFLMSADSLQEKLLHKFGNRAFPTIRLVHAIYLKMVETQSTCICFIRPELLLAVGTNSNATISRTIEKGKQLGLVKVSTVFFQKGDLKPGTYFELNFDLIKSL